LEKTKNNSAIGVLDSGVGGLSTLAMLKKILPNENFIFYADHKNAPYGDKAIEDVEEFVYDIVKYFASQNVKAIVIACNTAVSATIEKLRQEFCIPILGLEPAIKLAYDENNKESDLVKEKNLVIMATKLTINGEKLKKLLKRLNIENKVKKISASGLVELIETQSLKITEYLDVLLKDINENDYSSIVLGCTHYIFVKNEIRKVIGNNIKLIDGNLGVSLHLKNILKENNIENLKNQDVKVRLVTSGNNNDLKKMDFFYKKAKDLCLI